MKGKLCVITFLILLFSLMSAANLHAGRFGKLPKGNRLKRIEKSPNFKNGSFQNQSYTPVLTEGVSSYAVGKEFLFGKKNRVKPVDTIPSAKTNLLALDKTNDVIVWFGHSSYFIQIDGKRILVDPVLSNHASPFSFSITAFEGTTLYSADDIPEIDYLFITHDHWDHLDFETIKKLQPKIRNVICGLGVGAHFEKWGYNINAIIERDWNEIVNLDSGFVAYVEPARHFSGRGLTRNKSLWVSFVLKTPTMSFFLGGDGGYDKHFAEIGKTFGSIDLAILDNGQYDKSWKYIHLMPSEIIRAYTDLNAKRLFCAHSSKFTLANHPWDEPLINVSALSQESNIPLMTPVIGELVRLKDTNQKFTQWWLGIE